MGKFVVGIILMGAGIVWYFGWPGGLFVAGGLLATWGWVDHLESQGR